MIIDFNKLEYKNFPWVDIMSLSTGGFKEHFRLFLGL